MHRCGLHALLLLALAPARGADAFNYSLTAQAGGAGDSAESVDDSSVEATYTNPLEISPNYETYDAHASGTGALSASASAIGIPPFAAISHRAAARIEETIRLLPPPFPTGPVTVTVGIAATLLVSRSGTVAHANALAQIEPFSETCRITVAYGEPPAGSCPGGTVGDTSVTRTFSLEELSARNWEIDVAAQVEARFGQFQTNGAATVSASGALYAQVSGGGVSDFSWSGTNTNIPAPEPGSSALGAAAALTLRLRARRTS